MKLTVIEKVLGNRHRTKTLIFSNADLPFLTSPPYINVIRENKGKKGKACIYFGT